MVHALAWPGRNCGQQFNVVYPYPNLRYRYLPGYNCRCGLYPPESKGCQKSGNEAHIGRPAFTDHLFIYLFYTRRMRYWIVVASKDHIARGVAGGFVQANHGKAGPLKRMHVNDGVICYSSKQTYG